MADFNVHFLQSKLEKAASSHFLFVLFAFAMQRKMVHWGFSYSLHGMQDEEPAFKIQLEMMPNVLKNDKKDLNIDCFTVVSRCLATF